MRTTDRGASAVEYALLLAGIAVAVLLVLPMLSGSLSSRLGEVAATAGAPAPVATPAAAPAAAPAPTLAATSSPTTSAPTPAATTSPPVTGTSSAPPAGALTVRRGREVVAVTLARGASATTPRPTLSPASAGELTWDDGELVLETASDADRGPVTVTWTAVSSGTKRTTTTTVWIV